MIKLIATDVDGTLVKDGTMQIDPEYMTVIKELVQKGIIFAVCSGRQFISERKLFAPIKDQLLYITDGGTVVRTPQEILMVHTMPRDVWSGMCRMVQEQMPHCDCFVATPDYCLAEDAGSRMFHWLRDSYGYDIREAERLADIPEQDIINSPFTTNPPVRKCVHRSSPRHGKTRHSLPLPAKSGWTAIRPVQTREPRSSSCRSISAFPRKRPARSGTT